VEEREGKRQNSHDLRGHGNSLLELQHLVFMLRNASTSNVTTGIFCPNSTEGGGEGVEERKKKKKTLMQNQGSTTEPALSKKTLFKD